MEKMTYVVALNTAIARLNDLMEEDLAPTISKLTDLRDATIKRNSKERKPTPKEQAKAETDSALADAVLAVLSNATDPMTVTAIKEADEAFAEVKVQKLSAVVRKLLLDGKVKREEVKHKAMFSIA